jgi:cytosine/adenosine deaminase-related metal-dependent hydrolase
MIMLGADWIFPVTSPPLQKHALEIESGKIRTIRPLRDSESCQPGSCLLPGLVNVHTHLAYTSLRNLFDDLSFFPWIRKLTETKYQQLSDVDIEASTYLGIQECLSSGITTVADMSDHEASLRRLSQSPLRGIFYWEIFGVEREAAEQSFANLQRSYPVFHDQYSSDRLQIGVSPHSCYTVRPELFQKVAVYALEKEIPISFHLSESREEEEFIQKRSGPIHDFLQHRASDWKFGARSVVSHLEPTGIFQTRPLLAHLVQVDEEDLAILEKYNISIAHCPKSNSKFAHGIAPLMEFLRRKFRIGLGTDSAASNNRLDLFEEGRFAMYQQRIRTSSLSISEQEILELLTIRGASALNLEDRIGSLESGKAADVIELKIPAFYTEAAQVLRHLVYNAVAADVIRTYIDGIPVMLPDKTEEIKEIYRKLSNK